MISEPSTRLDTLRRQLGAAWVDDFVGAADAVGQARLPGDEDLAFGFLQRVLAHLKQSGKNRGLIFPKRDETTYKRFFDYFDADGGIWVIHPGEGPDQVATDPAWFQKLDLGDPERAYYDLTPGAARAIALAFLGALAHLRTR